MQLTQQHPLEHSLSRGCVCMGVYGSCILQWYDRDICVDWIPTTRASEVTQPHTTQLHKNDYTLWIEYTRSYILIPFICFIYLL